MVKKPTYEELEEKIKKLEQAESERKLAEERLKESEKRWQSLTANTNDIIQILDIEGRILFQNRVYPPHKLEDVIGKFVFDFTHDDYKEITQKSINRLLAGEGPQTFEDVIILSESEIAQFEVKYVPMLNNGRVDRIIATVTDVSEKKKAEHVLKESEEKFRNLFNTSVDGIMVIDAETGMIIDINKACEQMYGYSKEEFLQLKLTDVSNESEKSQKAIKLALDGTLTKIPVRYHKKKAGTIFPIEISVGTFLLKDKKVVCGVLRDITDRMHAEKELLFKENIIKSASSIISTCDLDGYLTYVNPVFYKKWEVDESEDVTGRHLTEFWDVKEILDESMETLLSTGIWFGECKAKRKDGSFFDIQVTTGTVNDSNGNIIALASTSIDITDRIKAEETLKFTQFAIDHYSDGAFWMEADARFIYVNNAACNILGYSREDLLNMTVHDIDPDFTEEIWSQHWSDLKKRGSLIVESHYRTKTGKIFPVEILLNYVEFEGKEYNCAFSRDISERKLAESERENIILELQNALNKVKQLSGLIPICSNCKKIRDDKGYWKQIELYIHEHSEAEFSHSICEECSDKLYGDEEWFKNLKERTKNKNQ